MTFSNIRVDRIEGAELFNLHIGLRNILIDSLVIAGWKATDAATANIEVGNFVEGVHFK